MSTQKLPETIGGYQHLQPEVITEGGDILVIDGKPIGFAALGYTVGEVEHIEAARVYRRMACPRQGGDRPLTQDEKDAMARGTPTPLVIAPTYNGPAHSAPVAREEGAGVMRVAALPTAPKAATYDDGKPPLACLPLKALREVAMVQLYGHKKYGDFYNYRKGMEVSRNASCAMRHIADYMDGQDLDAESQRNHLAHAACRLLFMLENLAEGTAIDDRYGKRK